MGNGFWTWWQNLPQHIDPVLCQLGPIELRYYGLMFAGSFVVVYVLCLYRIKNETHPYNADQLSDYFFNAIVGGVVGGRLGYVLFYDLSYFARYPLQIILPFSHQDGLQYTGISGMSYHGGLIGVVLATYLFCRTRKLNLWAFGDFLAPCVPLGYSLGRLGNFLNGELYGRLTNVAWGMNFPGAPGLGLRHPSQLYEMFFEGIVLFAVLWPLRRRIGGDGTLMYLYIIGYGAVRFVIEYFRQPDAHLGLVAFSMSQGQWLCLGMIGVGLLLWWLRPGRIVHKL